MILRAAGQNITNYIMGDPLVHSDKVSIFIKHQQVLDNMIACPSAKTSFKKRSSVKWHR